MQEESLLDAAINSAARHSAMFLVFLKEAFLAYEVKKKIAWEILLKEETSTACLLAEPPLPILVESSLGPEFVTALMITLI